MPLLCALTSATYTENEIFLWENGNPSQKRLAVLFYSACVPFRLSLLFRALLLPAAVRVGWMEADV